MYIKRITKTEMKKSKLPNVEDILKTKNKKIYDDLNDILEKNHDTGYYNWQSKLFIKNFTFYFKIFILKTC